MAVCTAWNWWYPAIFLTRAPLPSSSNTMKSRTRASNRRGSQAPSSSTRSCGKLASASVSPAIVRQRLNHSQPAVNVPMRASSPFDTMSAALKANSEGISAL